MKKYWRRYLVVYTGEHSHGEGAMCPVNCMAGSGFITSAIQPKKENLPSIVGQFKRTFTLRPLTPERLSEKDYAVKVKMGDAWVDVK